MHAGELYELDFLRGVAERLRAAVHGQKNRIVEDARTHLGCSRDALYAKLRGVGWNSGRKLRADKGDTRVTTEAMKNVAGILQASRRTTGKSLLPVRDAISVAVSNGLLTDEVSAATMLRVMRKNGCHPSQLAQPSPHTSMRSLHPNHVWQLDASICVLYYLRNGRVGVMDERKFNARKPKDLARVSNLRVLRYAVTDHTSGDVIARYYHAAGEDQDTLFQFLMHAMQPQAGRVMHGVPWMMVWDAGSANQSHGIKNLLDALAVRHWAHTPGNSRAKGQVECVHNIIERRFEGRLTFTRVDSVEQLNAELDRWLLMFNGTDKHSRHGHARDAEWQLIRTDQLRLCPDAATCAVMMHSKPEPRTVAGNLTITYKPRRGERATYNVAGVPDVRVGERVWVVMNAYRPGAIFVITSDADGSTRHIECESVALGAHGFFADAPTFGERYAATRDTDVDTARKDANELAYGERDALDALAAKTKGAIAFNGTIDPFADVREKAAQTPAFMQRRGTELYVPNPVQTELKPLDLVEALFALRARLGRSLEGHESAAIRTWFPDGVPHEELDGLVARVEQLSAAGAPPAFNELPRLVAVK